MYSVEVLTTDDRDLPAPELGVGLDWDRITAILRRELSAAAADLLAEPIADPERGQTHWHIATTEDPKPLAALGGAERERVLYALDQRRREILGFADRLTATAGEAELRLAAALRTIVETPDPERHLWSVNGQPVLTAWGRRSHDQRAHPSTIIGSAPKPLPLAASTSAVVGTSGASGTPEAAAGKTLAAASPPPLPPSPVVTAVPRRPLWPALLLWLLLALLLLAILGLLLPACAVHVPLVGRLLNRCPAPVDAALTTLRERNLSLREALRTAESEAAQRAGDCAPPHQAPPPLPGPSERTDRPDAQETEERSRAAKGSEGVLDVTLAWNGREDLDLHVQCPGDGHIWAESRTACGGTLEIDRNRSADDRADSPVEHVTWSSTPPPGEYRVFVILYNRFELPPRNVPFTVVIRDGNERRVFNGVVPEVRSPVLVTQFQR